MIYLFSGSSSYLVRKKTSDWKKLFLEKHGDFDLIHIKDLYKEDKSTLANNLTGASFFGGKKLIIIDNSPNSTKKSGERELKTENKKASSVKDLEEYIISLIDKIPDDNIVIFSSVNPDKRGKLFKKLKEIGKCEDFSAIKPEDLTRVIKEKYQSKIDIQAINLIIKYKSGDLEKIISELDKLLITFDRISVGEITKYITPELEESIFSLIDDILAKNKVQLIKKLRIILETESIYGFYNNLLANLRFYFYVFKLRDIGLSNTEIGRTIQLGNRAFLLNKKHNIKPKEFISLYNSILEIDKTMKSGKLIGTTESDFNYELEKTFLHI